MAHRTHWAALAIQLPQGILYAIRWCTIWALCRGMVILGLVNLLANAAEEHGVDVAGDVTPIDDVPERVSESLKR